MFTFSTTTNQKVIEFEKSGAVVSINVTDGGDEFNSTLADLSSYVTKTADGYYTDGIYGILDNTVSYIFKGFTATAVADINGVQYELNYDSLGAIEYSDAQKSFFVVANGSRVSLYSQLYFDISGSLPVDLTQYMPIAELPLGFSYSQGIFTYPQCSSLSSLNGNGCEYADGDFVVVDSRSEKFSVIRSYFIMLSDNTYSPCYDLLSDDNVKRVSVPEALLTLFVLL